MRLIDEIMTKMVVMEKKKLPDGEGGFFNSYVESAEFEAAVTIDAPAPVIMVAETKAIVGPYKITVNANVEFSKNDIVKRISDGQYFQITSDTKDVKPPKSAGLQKMVLEAEKISRLPV